MKKGGEGRRLAKVVGLLVDAGGIEAVCDALVSKRLTVESTAARHCAVASGSRVVESCLGELQGVWQEMPGWSGGDLAIAIQAGAEVARQERKRMGRVEVVWTGPRATTSYLRGTRQVVLDLLRQAQSEILVVGYWLARFGEGVLGRIVEQIALAKKRGARVVVVLDQGARPDGETNRELFLSLWPANVDGPRLYTWKVGGDDEHLKLHAKVIVADRCDALVTSANLTMHAMDLNMEMGVRVIGSAAELIAAHFDQLIAEGTLEPYESG